MLSTVWRDCRTTGSSRAVQKPDASELGRQRPGLANCSRLGYPPMANWQTSVRELSRLRARRRIAGKKGELMASPQLQMAKDAYKAVMDSGAKTPQELRVVFEKFAADSTVPPDIKSEKVNAGGIEAEWISAPKAAADRAVLYVHGGGYVIGSINTHRDLMGRIARASGARVLGINYRLAPEHPFPAAADDQVAAYRWMLAQGLKPNRIAVAGDSAGGGLTVATLVAIRDAQLPIPGAGVCASPRVRLGA